METAQLQTALVSLDAFLEAKAPLVSQTLRRGATEKERQRLAERLFGGKTLPPAVDVWFSWHNGQSPDGPALLPVYDLSPFHLASVKEGIDAHRTCQSVYDHGELSGPWNRHWLPIFEGEYGDHLVLETSGSSPGVVRALWHETARREVVAGDLLKLVARIKRAWSKETRPSPRRKVKDRAEIPIPSAWGGATFETIRTPPSADSLAEESVGIAYLVSDKRSATFHHLLVKVAPKTWAYTSMCGPVEECWEWLRQDTLGPMRSWAKSDAAAAEELTTAMNVLKRLVRRRMTKVSIK